MPFFATASNNADFTLAKFEIQIVFPGCDIYEELISWP